MQHAFRSGVVAAVLLAFLAGCEGPAKKQAPAQQKVEAPKRYPVPAAARQPKPRPSELKLEPTSPPTPPPTARPTPWQEPNAESLVVRNLRQKLDQAQKEKAEAEQSAAALRKALDETLAAREQDRKELQEARARQPEAAPQKPKSEPAKGSVPKDEGTFQKLLDQGRELYDRNDFAAARRLFQGLADLGYENGTMFFMLGRCCQEMDDQAAALSNYSKACDAFEDAQPRPPTYPRALLNMGVIFRAQKRYRDAEEAYHRAIKADPRYPNPYYNLGLLYEECLKDNPKALAAYEKYIDLHGERYQEAQDHAKRLQAMAKPAGK